MQAEGRAALTLRPLPYSKKTWQRLYLFAFAVWGLDLATKIWVVSQLSNGTPVKLIGTFLQLNFTRNSGAAFSLATGSTLFLTLFAITVLVVISYYALKIDSKAWATTLGLLMGGILGNLTDRFFRQPGFLRGQVIDWIQLQHWPIFNIADSAIVIAAGISILLSIRNVAPISKTGSPA